MLEYDFSECKAGWWYVFPRGDKLDLNNLNFHKPVAGFEVEHLALDFSKKYGNFADVLQFIPNESDNMDVIREQTLLNELVSLRTESVELDRRVWALETQLRMILSLYSSEFRASVVEKSSIN